MRECIEFEILHRTIMENTVIPLEEDILNDLLTALLSEIISHDLGIHKRQNCYNWCNGGGTKTNSKTNMG